MSDLHGAPRRPAPRSARRRLRLWMAVNGVVLVALVSAVVGVSGSTHARTSAAAAGAAASTTATPGPTRTSAPQKLPTKQEVLAETGRYFGVSAPDVPWSSEDVDKVAASAGVTPDLMEYFVTWNQDFSATPVDAAYKHGAIPMISWEPWGGSQGKTTADDVAQPKYALANIISGKFDAYITKFATDLRTAGLPVAIRFAHEMNGHWYPWSETVNGNKAGEYARAWRHVHDLFTKAGADKVIWVWSPNNLGGAGSGPGLAELYPGDAYVDWIGLSAYLTAGNTPAQVIDPALKSVRRFTAKPFLVTETGAEPGPTKAARTASLFAWLDAHPDVLGFIWFQTTKTTGAGTDWRFDADTVTQAAFQKGVKTLQLVKGPVVTGLP